MNPNRRMSYCKRCINGIPHKFEHGTNSSGYNYHGCRCALCSAWNAGRCAAGRADAQSRRETDMPDKAHGTVNGYRYWGCKCDACTKANNQGRKDWDKKKANGYRAVTPTRR